MAKATLPNINNNNLKVATLPGDRSGAEDVGAINLSTTLHNLHIYPNDIHKR